MNQPRRIMPLPLGGGEHGLPYSRGLMARSLMATASPPTGRTRSRAASATTSASVARDVVDLGRLEALAVEILGEDEGSEAIRRLRRYQSCASSTCRS